MQVFIHTNNNSTFKKYLIGNSQVADFLIEISIDEIKNEFIVKKIDADIKLEKEWKYTTEHIPPSALFKDFLLPLK